MCPTSSFPVPCCSARWLSDSALRSRAAGKDSKGSVTSKLEGRLYHVLRGGLYKEYPRVGGFFS